MNLPTESEVVAEIARLLEGHRVAVVARESGLTEPTLFRIKRLSKGYHYQTLELALSWLQNNQPQENTSEKDTQPENPAPTDRAADQRAQA